jgi:hypothetical protein
VVESAPLFVVDPPAPLSFVTVPAEADDPSAKPKSAAKIAFLFKDAVRAKPPLFAMALRRPPSRDDFEAFPRDTSHPN